MAITQPVRPVFFSVRNKEGISTDLLAGTVRNSISWQGRPYVWLATSFENLDDKLAPFVHYSLLDICSTYLFRHDYLRERDKLQAS